MCHAAEDRAIDLIHAGIHNATARNYSREAMKKLNKGSDVLSIIEAFVGHALRDMWPGLAVLECNLARAQIANWAVLDLFASVIESAVPVSVASDRPCGLWMMPPGDLCLYHACNAANDPRLWMRTPRRQDGVAFLGRHQQRDVRRAQELRAQAVKLDARRRAGRRRISTASGNFGRSSICPRVGCHWRCFRRQLRRGAVDIRRPTPAVIAWR